jgi:hypothetical protein
MQVDFFVPGFSKCGTTTLCAMLAEHPAVFIPESKEPGFFAHFFDFGWEWYAKHFADARPGQVMGEGSTFYSSGEFAEVACTRIAEHFPAARLIFIARNPIARLESSFREIHDSGREYAAYAPYSIGEALQKFPSMIEDTLYWQRLSTFRRRFPDDRILTVLLEDFQARPAEELARCFRFLGVDPSAHIGDSARRLNPGEKKMYDSRLMRFLRTRRWIPRWWGALPESWRTRCIKWLGLRKPFSGPIHWDADARAWLVERIAADARQFLAYCGKPADFWKLEAS